MSVEPVASNTYTSTVTRLKGQWLWLGRSIWAVLAAMTIIAFLIAAQLRFETLRTVCNADCQIVQISELGLNRLQEEFGLSLDAYAIIIIAKEILFSVIYIIAGIVVYWRRSDDWLVIFISLTLMIFGQATVSQVDILFFNFLLGLGYVLLLNLFFLFPDGRFVPAWTQWLGIILGIPVLISPFTPLFQTIIWWVYVMAASISGIAAQIYRYRRVATPIQRQQTKWVLFGFGFLALFFISIAVPIILFSSALNPPNEPTVSFADLIIRGPYAYFLFACAYVLPITIAFSTLRYRLWDADPIINRGLVYGFMTLFAVILLFVITYLIQFLFGEQQPLIAILIAAVVSGLTFNPARKRIQHWVDRNLYGLRFDLNELQAAQIIREIKNSGALTGQVVDGYEILGVIGKGGMGEVYRGFGSGQEVAIKTMLPELAKDETMRTRFQREAETGKQLQHRNIARVFASGVIDDTPYLVMEYIEGTELGAMLKQDGTLDIETASQILKDVCAALEIAHQQGFVHRDIKPANIMIRENGEAVLMDFGIMKMQDTTSALTGTGVIGTIDYMAPEQITAAKTLDHRADIYALGVMLYQMLTGEKPFSGGAAQVMFAHLQQPPPDVSDINPDIPYELADAIEKAMAKNPDERFQTAREFAESLTLQIAQ